MVTKSKKSTKSSAERQDEKVQKEIELEREHPEKIITDELSFDKNSEGEPENPELQKSSMKLVVLTLFIILALLASVYYITSFLADRFEYDIFYEYNGFTFEKYEDVWYTSFKLGNTIYPLPFHYGPRDLEDIPFSVIPDNILSSEFIYLAIPPVEEFSNDDGRRIAQAAIEVGKIIGTQNNIFNIPARAVLSSESEMDTETPVIDCINATSVEAVIKFSIGEVTAVYEDSEYPNCYHIIGVTGRDVIRSANRLVYGLVGIMN